MRHPIITAALFACCLVSRASAQAPAAADAPPLIPADVQVETVADGFKFTEGPALVPDGSILFSDIPNNRIHRFIPATGQTEIAEEDTGGANGLAISATPTEHYLLMGVACRGTARKLSLKLVKPGFEGGGPSEYGIDVLFFDEARFNSPNDVVISKVGDVYFTDPRYGKRDDMEMEVEGVYHYHPAQDDPVRLIDNLVRPNGIALSPDEKTLYVNDHGAKKVMAYPLLAPGKVGEGKVLFDTAEVGGPDGMCVDHAGRLYIAIFDAGGILVLSPEGERLGFIETGPQTTNCTFGADGRTLYVTADKSLKRVVLNTGAEE